MKLNKLILVSIFVIITLVSTVSCQSVNRPYGPDKDGSYTSSVYYTGEDVGRFTVRYIALKEYADDVYPGDCALYTTPDGLNMMVDCGNQISYKELIPILDSMGITQIDVFVMSHCHADHIGSFIELAKKYNIKKVYKNYVDYTSDTYQGIAKYLEDSNIDVQLLYEGDTFSLGNEVNVEVFWPFEGQTVDMTDAGKTNSSSIAMKITYKDSSFWSSGDLYVADEHTLVEKYGDKLQCDVMKMNHHGRETSNSKEFINTIQPKIAIAMQGEFSSQTIFNWYRTSHVVPFHSLFDGTVMVSTTGDGHYEVQVQYIREQMNLYGKPAEDGHYSF